MIDPTPERAQQAQMLEAFAEKVDGRKVMMAWEREHNVAFMEALNAGAAALRAQSAREWQEQVEARFAELIAPELEHYAQKIAKRVLRKAFSPVGGPQT